MYAGPLSDEALRADCVLILPNHTNVDYANIVRQAQHVSDTRNATGHVPHPAHLTLAQTIAILDSKKQAPPACLADSDDGYVDNLFVAVPFLQACGMTVRFL